MDKNITKLVSGSVLVSVIIPVYNDQDGLDKCLAALGEQNYPSDLIQVIVVDNNSTPLIRICNTYPFSIHVVMCRKPGSYAARNVGVQVSSGEILAFTDSDCVPDRNWIYNAVDFFHRHPEVSAIGGSVTIVASSQRRPSELFESVFAFNQQRNILEHGFSVTANMMMLASTYMLVGPFDERVFSGGDREWCYRLQRHDSHLSYVPQVRVNHPARTSLTALIKKRRRVTGGQWAVPSISESVPEFNRLNDESKPRGAAMALTLCFHPKRLKLSHLEGIKVLFVSVLLIIVSFVERLLISLGKKAIR